MARPTVVAEVVWPSNTWLLILGSGRMGGTSASMQRYERVGASAEYAE